MGALRVYRREEARHGSGQKPVQARHASGCPGARGSVERLRRGVHRASQGELCPT